MIEIFALPLTLITLAIFWDLAFNDGDGLSSIISSMKSQKSRIDNPDQSKIDMVKQLLEELDELRDDLTYDNSEEDKKAIEDKIKDRERVLDKLLDK